MTFVGATRELSLQDKLSLGIWKDSKNQKNRDEIHITAMEAHWSNKLAMILKCNFN